MTATLPPARELPPGRHERIRAELLREIEPKRRRWLAPLALAGAATAIAVAVALTSWLTAPGPTYLETAGPKGVPGLSTDQVKIWTDRCFGESKTKGWQLYNHDDARTAVALAFQTGGRGVSICGMKNNATKTRSDMVPGNLGWLTSHVTVDMITKVPGAPNVGIIVGRVAKGVKYLHYSSGDNMVMTQAVMANGTFVITAFDEDDFDGTLDYVDPANKSTTIQVRNPPNRCVRIPEGPVLVNRDRAFLGCAKAMRWTYGR